jgi:type II pantothenate kinase
MFYNLKTKIIIIRLKVKEVYVMILGIDIGGSTTDIVGIDNNEIFDLFTVEASDPTTSAYGALGKMLTKNRLDIADIDKIAITGVGSSYIDSTIFGIKTIKVDEFEAIGLGGSFLSGINKALVVSLGTGTAMVNVNKSKIEHIGGTGIGGGTLLGLGKGILNIIDFEEIIELAKHGNLHKVDLTIGDISNEKVGTLNQSVTASNLGNVHKVASEEDYAKGILNLIYQNIGMLAVFGAQMTKNKDIVFTGKLAQIEEGITILKALRDNKSYDIKLHFPENATFSTAIGAAIAVINSDDIN